MKKLSISTAAILAGGALYALAGRQRKPQRAGASDGFRRFVLYAGVPAWLGSGFTDYLWHRKTKIATTSGPAESVTHLLMMAEGGPAILAGLFLEVNAGAMAVISASALAHQATAVWDVAFTAPRRVIPTGEQHTHAVMETVPLALAAAAACYHWEQFLAIFGAGSERPDWSLRLRRPRLPATHIAVLLGATAFFGGIPHLEELVRCIRARRQGLTESDTPECTRELYSSDAADRGVMVRIPTPASSLRD